MSAVVAVCLAALMVLTAIGVHQVQGRLERWDYNRHLLD